MLNLNPDRILNALKDPKFFSGPLSSYQKAFNNLFRAISAIESRKEEKGCRGGCRKRALQRQSKLAETEVFKLFFQVLSKHKDEKELANSLKTYFSAKSITVSVRTSDGKRVTLEF